MSRPDKIERILVRRTEKADRLQNVGVTVDRIESAIDSLHQCRIELAAQGGSSVTSELERITQGMAEVRRQASALRTAMARTDARLRRGALSIGAVGRGGQGKSQFLQSLTGLTDREIPTARGGFMTGVPSIIRHSPGPTTAAIEFHDTASFVAEVLTPYYAELRLGAPPRSLDAFAGAPVPQPPEGASVRAGSAYRDLLSYHDHLHVYQARLESLERVVPVRPEEILSFVAQHDGQGNALHDFRAVRRARISAPFRQDGLGALTVVDLPGLGDVNLRDEFVLRQALDNEVDAIVFVRRPDPIRDKVQDHDVDLYDVARNALPDLPLDRWSFLLLNRMQSADNDNSLMVERFPEFVEASALEFVSVMTADCTVVDQVSTAFEAVLDHAVTVVDELDDLLINRHRQELGVLKSEVARLADEASALAGRAVPSGAWFPRFTTLFNETLRTLAVGLERTLREFREDVTAQDDIFLARIQEAAKSARDSIVVPSSDRIAERRDELGSYQRVFAELTDEFRTALSLHFLGLDDALKNRVELLHTTIAATMRESGGLAVVSPLEGREFLVDLLRQLPPGNEQLSYGLRFLSEFTLNYRGFIQHRVRRALQKLAPDVNPLAANAEPGDIQYLFEELVPEVIFDIETELEGIAHEPYEAVFAVAEEFCDRVLRSEGAVDEWRTFYEIQRTRVWADEFDALATATDFYNRWTRAQSELARMSGGEATAS